MQHAENYHLVDLTVSNEQLQRKKLLLLFGAFTTALMTTGCGGGNSSNDTIAPKIDTGNSVGAVIADVQNKCASLLGQSIEGAVISHASFKPASGDIPDHCEILGQMPQELNFKMKLPARWNEGTVFIGGGGFDGNVNGDMYSPKILERGYTTISTNHGHEASASFAEGEFALDNEKLNEYAHLAVPRVLQPARAVMRIMYGEQKTASSKIVYEGCSGGGRQALIEAQRYPNLFDGIIARAPANAYVPQFLHYQKVMKQLDQTGAALSFAKIKTLHGAVLKQCDSLDGLKDDIISRPDLCGFNVDTLRCTGAESDSCLTDPQIQSAKTIYSPTDVGAGKFSWPGFPFGIELAYPDTDPFSWQTVGGPAFKGLNDGFMKYFVTRDPLINPSLVDPNQYIERLETLSTLIDAVDPDLNAFSSKGGKLILWHGLSDSLITANNTISYYNKVVATAGGKAAADNFVQFYTAPGVEHCAAGSGADLVDFIGPMFDWINKATPPSSQYIVATQSNPEPGKAAVKRPLCLYPQYPKYNGTGDPTLDTSFSCTNP